MAKGRQALCGRHHVGAGDHQSMHEHDCRGGHRGAQRRARVNDSAREFRPLAANRDRALSRLSRFFSSVIAEVTAGEFSSFQRLFGGILRSQN